MGYVFPLYRRHPIFDFLDPKKTQSDAETVREYFESNDASKVVHLVEENDQKYLEYLSGLLKVRRRKLFNSESEIPEEKDKIAEQASAGNKLAIEMKKILDAQAKIPRSWPITEVEKNKKRYAEWKKIKRMEQQAFNYLLYEALKEIYYPAFFFEQEIFKLEDAYGDFKYDFMSLFLGPEGVYISYLIYQKKGTEQVFDNLKDFTVNRYVPKPTIGIDAISLLHLFIWDGNDANNCNRFFTRRMKRDISSESREHTYLTNNMTGKGFEDAFKRLFYSDPSSVCNLKNPFTSSIGEPGLIEQAVLNHLIGNYSAAANLFFPIIEGIIWDISVAEHLRNRTIYTQDSDLTTRDVRQRTLLGRDGSAIPKSQGYPTLKDLLESTRMGDILNTDFLKMLIQEVYPADRNPILHGVKLDYNDPWQSARMLLMLEYLHRLIGKENYLYPLQLDEPDYWTPEKSKEDE